MRIGEYIHYRYSNYRKHGLSIASGSPVTEQDIASILQEQHDELLKSLNERKPKDPQLKADLERKLNFYFTRDEMLLDANATKEQAEELRKIIQDICETALQQSVKKGLNQTVRNYETLVASNTTSLLDLSSESDLREELSSLLQTTLGGKRQEWTTESAIARRVQFILKLKEQANKLGITKTKGQAFINMVNDLDDNYKGLMEEYKNMSTLSKKHVSLNDNTMNFVKGIEAILEAARSETNTKVQGYLGEYIPVITQYVTAMVAKEGIDTCLSKLTNLTDYADITKQLFDNGLITGDNRSRKVLLKDKVAVGGKSKAFSQTVDAKIDGVDIKTNFTQDKVDIVVSMPDNTAMNASVKNVNLFSGKNIHVHSGRSILEMMQDYPKFSNHYLNLTIHNPIMNSISKDIIQKAHDTLKLTVALHALTGKQWSETKEGNIVQTQQAELFIVNDQRGAADSFKVYYMADLLQSVDDNLSYLHIKDFDKVTNRHGLEYANKWADPREPNRQSAYKRIHNLLAHFHSASLEVSINPQVLNVSH